MSWQHIPTDVWALCSGMLFLWVSMSYCSSLNASRAQAGPQCSLWKYFKHSSLTQSKTDGMQSHLLTCAIHYFFGNTMGSCVGPCLSPKYGQLVVTFSPRLLQESLVLCSTRMIRILIPPVLCWPAVIWPSWITVSRCSPLPPGTASTRHATEICYCLIQSCEKESATFFQL